MQRILRGVFLEGPPLKVIAEKLSFLTGEEVLTATGNAKIEMSALIGKHFLKIYTIGKNLLLQFQDNTVRVHFVMYGSYAINQARMDITPSLSLVSRETELNFYRCSVKLLRNDEVNVLFDEEVDVLSERWNPTKVLKLMRDKKDEFVCDVLLDQTVFAGVGNIIKNEALFLANVHPLSIISKLPLKKLKDIIHETKEFSILFYELRKNDCPIRVHYKIYGRSLCPESNQKVVRSITGKRKRISYICMSVQFQYV